MQNSIQNIYKQLGEYKQKFYLNKLWKGLLISATIILGFYIFINSLEYFGHFGTNVRKMFFYSFLILLLFTFYKYLLGPIQYFFNKKKQLSNEQAALQIGEFFPEIKDKLINTVQLASSSAKSELLEASITQKTKQLGIVKFTDAIKNTENKKYAKYLLIPASLLLGIFLIAPSYFAESSKRIVNFENEYAEPAPFTFEIKNKNLEVFKYEDFELNLKMNGKAIPQEVFIIIDGRKIALDSKDKINYKYIFRNVQSKTKFFFEAAGFNSDNFSLDVINRPSISRLKMALNYPTYLNKTNTFTENSGNANVPEGTQITWTISAENTDSIIFEIAGKKTKASPSLLSNDFEIKQTFKNSADYKILLYNSKASNKDLAQYSISVIPDNYPSINLESYKDTTLYNYVVIGGKISDDYGISNLKLFYQVDDSKGKLNYKGSVPIEFQKNQTAQSFLKTWSLDSLKLSPGDKISYFVQVWDNDGYNGPKAAKSVSMEYKMPGIEQLEKAIENSAEKTETQMDKALEKAMALKKEISEFEKKLKTKPELSFQDKKELEDILKKKEELMQEIMSLQKQNAVSNEQQQRFNQQKPEIMEKMNQLDSIIKKLLDEETNKMYENLKQQLEKQDNEKMLDELDKLKNKEKNLEKDLERALKLFKKLEKEKKVDKAIQDLLKQAEKQDKLADKNEKDADDKKDDSDLKDQESIEKEFEKTMDDLKEAEEMSKELKEDGPLDDKDKKDGEDIKKEQKDAKNDLQKNDKKAAAKKQKKAANNMKKMADKMAGKKQDKESMEMEENIEDLKQIMENLVKLSFDQEKLMKDFRGIRIGDPRFVKLGQNQVKLKDDAKVIEDSLYALANRVFQIKSFVTKEVGLMKYHMDESSKSIKERKLNLITSKQQFAMTSMNNLALLLSETLNNMQMSMGEMNGKGKKSGKKNKLPMMSEKQKELNQKMAGKTGKDGKGGKDGKNSKEANGTEGSESIAKMAAEQAKIRKMLQDIADEQNGTKIGKELKDKMNDLIKKMDKSETEILNRQITQQTLDRQKEIEIRLLETEKAIKEQEQDEKRKAESGRDITKSMPKELEQYIKNKQNQKELIRTVPPNLTPFYKKEVDTYFKKAN